MNTLSLAGLIIGVIGIGLCVLTKLQLFGGSIIGVGPVGLWRFAVAAFLFVIAWELVRRSGREL